MLASFNTIVFMGSLGRKQELTGCDGPGKKGAGLDK